MDKDAVAQAKHRLLKLEKSLAALRAAENTEDAEEAWTDFLIAASTYLLKITAGRKRAPKK
jgi:hypothetical protein